MLAGGETTLVSTARVGNDENMQKLWVGVNWLDEMDIEAG
jgi:hypothetical protein